MEYAMQFINMKRQIINIQKTIIEFKELLYIIYWEANNLYGCIMSPKLFVDSFDWEKNTLNFDENFMS